MKSCQIHKRDQSMMKEESKLSRKVEVVVEEEASVLPWIYST